MIAMTNEEFRIKFPSLAIIAGPNWLDENHGWFVVGINDREAWFHRLDKNLNVLRQAVGDQTVTASY